MSRTGFFLTAALLIAALAGCGLPPAAIGSAAAVATGAVALPTWLNTGVTVLDDTAKMACAVQDIANAVGKPRASAIAGALCKW